MRGRGERAALSRASVQVADKCRCLPDALCWGTAADHLMFRPAHLVEVEDEVQLAHVLEGVVQHLNKQVDGLQARELVLSEVDAQREEQPRVSPVDHLVRTELCVTNPPRPTSPAGHDGVSRVRMRAFISRSSTATCTSSGLAWLSEAQAVSAATRAPRGSW